MNHNWYVATATLRLIALLVTVVIVASWPRARGKHWLLAVLCGWTAMSFLSVTNLFLMKTYGNGDSFVRLSRHFNLALSVVFNSMLVVAVLELRACLKGRLKSNLSFARGVMDAAPLGAGALVFVGMSMPWAHASGLWVSGWSSSLNVQLVHLPGVLVGVVAGIALAVLLAKPKPSQVRWLPLTLCGYGLLHTILMAMALLNTPSMKMGFGVMLCVIGFIALAFCRVGRESTYKPAPKVAPSA